jgi:predicted CoA-binding protein
LIQFIERPIKEFNSSISPYAEGGLQAVQDKCTMVEDKRCQNA